MDDFSALQQQVLEGRSLVYRMETTLQSCLGPPLLEGDQKKSSELVRAQRGVEMITARQGKTVEDKGLTGLCTQALDYGCIKSLLSNTKTLRQILEEAMSLLKMFWRAALPSTDPSVQNLKKV